MEIVRTFVVEGLDDGGIHIPEVNIAFPRYGSRRRMICRDTARLLSICIFAVHLENFTVATVC